MLADLDDRGMSQWSAAPPLFRLVWALGIAVPPPLFLSFSMLALLFGTFFGVVWSILTWIVLWRFWMPAEASIHFVWLGAVLAGIPFGLIMAAYYRTQAARLHLPSWENYPEASA